MAERLARAAGHADPVRPGFLQILELKAEILGVQLDGSNALPLYEEVIARAREQGWRKFIVDDLTLAGTLAEVMGERELGLEYNRRALFHVLLDRNHFSAPRVRMNIARRHRMNGDLDSCRIYQDEAIREVQAFPYEENLKRLPLLVAEYYAHVGEYDVVDSLLTEAARLAEKQDTDAARAELHLELIKGYMEAGRPDRVHRSIQAIEDLRQGYSDVHSDRNVRFDLNLAIAEFYTNRAEFEDARDALDMAAAALDSTDSTRPFQLARARGAHARAAGSFRAAEAALRECVELGRKSPTPEMESSSRLLLASFLLERGRCEEARSTLPETDEDGFRGRYTTRLSALILEAESYLAEGRTGSALEAIAQARSLLRKGTPYDLLARVETVEGRAMAAAGDLRRAGDRFRTAAGILAANPAAVESPEHAYFNGDLRRDLVEAVLGAAQMPAAESLEFARGVLPGWLPTRDSSLEGSTGPLAVYFVGRGISGRWIVAEGQVTWSALPGEQELKARLGALGALMNAGADPEPRSLQQAADVLLGGMAGSWPEGETLTIVPDLALFGVPWAALPLPDTGGLVLDRGPLAILDAPARAGLAAIHDPGGRLLAVGVDEAGSASAAGLKTLPNAEREAAAVADLWPAGLADRRLGAAAAGALAANPGLARYEAIHIASHALVFGGRADQAALMLAGETDEALTAARIAELELGADLVYLSACEAAYGRGGRGEFAGLARAFLDAGAGCVVAPLNVVDDQAAAALAARFHRNWVAGEPAHRALWLAQRELHEAEGGRWAHPFYWAYYQAVVGGD